MTTPECRETLDQGMAAYENLQWTQADGYYQQVSSRNCLCAEDQARVYLFWGAIAYQNGSVSRAQNYFRQARKLHPGMTVSKDYFPPPMVDFFQEMSTP
jgi:outer membrane protein assembly factor BamD (BamD/ComL family)